MVLQRNQSKNSHVSGQKLGPVLQPMFWRQARWVDELPSLLFFLPFFLPLVLKSASTVLGLLKDWDS